MPPFISLKRFHSCLALALGGLLALCLPARSLAQELVIGTSSAFKGPSRGLGIELYRGAMAYIEDVNQTGGVHGRKIGIKTYDDNYNPLPCIDNTVRLVEKDDVLLLFGYVGTPTLTRILPLLKSYDDRYIYNFFPFTGAQPQREPPYDDYVFNLRASYYQETAGLVNQFVSVGRKRIAFFYQNDAYGRCGWEGVRRGLAQHGLSMVAEATYRRGTIYSQSLSRQVEILRQGAPEAIICVGAYAGCAALIRDARAAGWDVPIANVSFVGSESLLSLLLQSNSEDGKDYTLNVINSQVVPSYHDVSLPAVRQYREFMDRYQPRPPADLVSDDYKTQHYSFIGLEGFLDAKLLVEILQRLGPSPQREHIKPVVESIKNLDLGIDELVSFGPKKHQGLDRVYYTVVEGERFVPITDWARWSK